jgi:hypothetical protein
LHVNFVDKKPGRVLREKLSFLGRASFASCPPVAGGSVVTLTLLQKNCGALIGADTWHTVGGYTIYRGRHQTIGECSLAAEGWHTSSHVFAPLLLAPAKVNVPNAVAWCGSVVQ